MNTMVKSTGFKILFMTLAFVLFVAVPTANAQWVDVSTYGGGGGSSSSSSGGSGWEDTGSGCCGGSSSSNNNNDNSGWVDVSTYGGGWVDVSTYGGSTPPVVQPPVTPPTLPPTCTLSAAPSSVNYGGSTILSWNSYNTTSASINNGIGSIGVNGVYSVSNLTYDKNYILTVNGSGGSTTCSTSVNVSEKPQPKNPTCYLSASRTSIQSGSAVTLSWGSTNTNSANLTNFGSVGTLGSYTVYPQSDRNYTLTVYGDGGSKTCSQYIDVYTIPVVHQKPSCTISTNPNSIALGKTSVLNWNSYNSISASINQLGGYTPLSGSRVIYPNTTTNYTMTVRNAYGDSSICSTNLGVYSIYVPPVTPQPIIRQYVSISNVPYTGPEDTAYILGLIGVLIASLGGAAVLYGKNLSLPVQASRRP